MRIQSPSTILLLACCMLIQTATAQQRRRVRGEVSPPPRRRLQENDKNNDKNKNKETPSPTPVPSVEPSAYPTPSPTVEPTFGPTSLSDSPTPTATTTRPTTPSPTFEALVGSVGNLAVRLNVMESSVTASDVEEGRAVELLDSILEGLLDVQCSMTDFQMVLEPKLNGPDACQERRRRRLQSGESPVIWSTTRLKVEDDVTPNGENYMKWRVVYPVLQIGETYVEEALKKSDDLATDSVQDVQGAALAAMQDEVEYALEVYIRMDKFDERLPETTIVSTGDFEVISDDPTDGGEPYNNSNNNNGGGTADAGGYWAPLNPDPIHGMRLAGIILLIVSTSFAVLIFLKSERRKKERELDMAMQKLQKGGIVTEEGLNFMLEVGRRETVSPQGEYAMEGTECTLMESISQRVSSNNKAPDVDDEIDGTDMVNTTQSTNDDDDVNDVNDDDDEDGWGFPLPVFIADSMR